MSACSPRITTFTPPPSQFTASTTTLPDAPPTPVSGTSTGCYYTWATRELPELGAAFDAELRRLEPAAAGSAYAFGEECRHEDGTVSFLAMESDYRARVPVTTLSDKTALGGWIRSIMAVVSALPQTLVVGTRPGRVEFEFDVMGAESLRLVIDIERYRLESDGLDDAGIFEHFSTSR